MWPADQNTFVQKILKHACHGERVLSLACAAPVFNVPVSSVFQAGHEANIERSESNSMKPVKSVYLPALVSGEEKFVLEESPFKGKTGVQRVLNAFNYSMAGLRAAFTCEDAFRQEALLAALMIPASFLLPVSGLGRALMIGSVLLVLIVELLNSAIEAVVDRISLDHHHLSKRAKDIGSAAVFLALLNVLSVWACVLIG